MKSIGITRISEKEEEIADSLQKLGMSRVSSLSLAGIRSLKIAKTRDIERITGLRQPEVSIGVRELRERGWVSETEEKKIGKGRPVKVYTLHVGFEIILTDLEREVQDKARKVSGLITKLGRTAIISEVKKKQ